MSRTHRIRQWVSGPALLLFALILAHPAKSATIDQHGGTVTLSGEILSTSAELFVNEFARAMLAAPRNEPVVITLNSPGGDARAAHRIADQIHSARHHGMKVETRVERGGMCMSACPLIFSAGEDRLVSSRSLFLFHGVVYQGPRATAQIVDALNAEKRAYIDRMRSVDPDLGNFLDRRRIVAENIEAEFDGASLRDIFPGFVTGMLAE